MLRFTVRRLINMVFVLWAVSVLTFLIFMVMPGGGDEQAALRIAGRNANEQQVQTVKREWGLDDPFYVQYADMMKKVFTGDLISYVNQVNVREEIVRGIPRTASLVIGAGIIWLFFGVVFGVLRSNVLDISNEDYVRTARSKGLSERRVLIRHTLRNALIPIVTLFGLDFGAALGGGAILTESVFGLQGVGQYASDSIGRLDLPPIMGVVLFGAFFIVLLNAIVDILYAFLDPRIRLQ